MFTACFFDIDDTLYNYRECDLHGIDRIISYIGISRTDFEIIYDECKNKVKTRATEVLSHSRSLYFEELVHHLGLPLGEILALNETYWDAFYEKMTLFDGVGDMLQLFKTKNIKICAITDFELEYQLNKLKKLGILEYFNGIVSSTQLKKEKPDINMFLYAFERIGCVDTDQHAIMIGDSFKKDIRGSLDSRLNIKPFWLISPSNLNDIIAKIDFSEVSYVKFTHFSVLNLFFIDYFTKIDEYVLLNKRFGEREDLCQAGGGNISIKLWGLTIVKQSGVHLADTTQTNGYNIIDNKGNIIFGDKKKRNSIETGMHLILDTYTVHIHPTQVNIISCLTDAQQVLLKIGEPNYLVIDYVKPGAELCEKILLNRKNNEQVIVLLNHGIIFTADSYSKCVSLMHYSLTKFNEISGFRDIYSHCNEISEKNDKYGTTILSCLKKPENTSIIKPLTPDYVVYCWQNAVFFVENVEYAYIHAKTWRKCKEIESVLRQHMEIYSVQNNLKRLNPLGDEQINELVNWDAEKYRKNIK